MNHNIDLNVNIAGIALENPVTVASGTFGFGQGIIISTISTNWEQLLPKALPFCPK